MTQQESGWEERSVARLRRVARELGMNRLRRNPPCLYRKNKNGPREGALLLFWLPGRDLFGPTASVRIPLTV
jgi:hypothetical protein